MHRGEDRSGRAEVGPETPERKRNDKEENGPCIPQRKPSRVHTISLTADDERYVNAAGCSRGAASLIVTTAPPWGAFVSSRLPRFASTIVRAIARPNPVP